MRLAQCVSVILSTLVPAVAQVATYRGHDYSHWRRTVPASFVQASLRSRALVALAPEREPGAEAAKSIATDILRWPSGDSARSLAALGHAGLTELLLLADHEMTAVRQAAAIGLMKAGPGGVEKLLVMVTAGQVDVGIFRDADAATAMALLPHLQGNHVRVQAVLQALYTMEANGIDVPVPVQKQLVPMLLHRQRDIGWWAQSVLRRGDPEAHVEVLSLLLVERDVRRAKLYAGAVCLRSTEPSSCWTAANGEHVGLLRKLLAGKSKQTQLTASVLLADVGRAAAIAEPDLLRLVRNERANPLVRISAVEALCCVADRTERRNRELRKVLASMDERYLSSMRLKILGDLALPAIMAGIRYRTPFEQDKALGCVAQLGPKAKPALPRLLTAMSEWPRINRLADTIMLVDPEQLPVLVPHVLAQARKQQPHVGAGSRPIEFFLDHHCASPEAITFYAEWLQRFSQSPTRRLLLALVDDLAIGRPALLAHVRRMAVNLDVATLQVLLESRVDVRSVADVLRASVEHLTAQHLLRRRGSGLVGSDEHGRLSLLCELLGSMGESELTMLLPLLDSPHRELRMAGVRGLLPMAAEANVQQVLFPVLLELAAFEHRNQMLIYRVQPWNMPASSLELAVARWAEPLTTGLLRPIVKRLASSEPSERMGSYALLSWLGPAASSAVPAIAAGLDVAEDEERNAVFYALQRVANPMSPIAGVMADWLVKHDGELSQWLRHQLSGMLQQEADWVLDAARYARPQVVAGLLDAVEAAQTVKVLRMRELHTAMSSDQDSVRLMAATVAAQHGVALSPELLRRAVLMLTDPGWRQRDAALTLLSKVEVATADLRRHVQSCTSDRDRAVREHAARVLAARGWGGPGLTFPGLVDRRVRRPR